MVMIEVTKFGAILSHKTHIINKCAFEEGVHVFIFFRCPFASQYQLKG
jgi:hypothetical protein